jgi:hypothetical protein
MPNRSSKKRPRDLNEMASVISGEAIGETLPEEEPTSDDGKDPAAVALGRKGGLKGGRARAEKLTAQQRTQIAKKAAWARWGKEEA